MSAVEATINCDPVVAAKVEPDMIVPGLIISLICVFCTPSRKNAPVISRGSPAVLVTSIASPFLPLTIIGVIPVAPITTNESLRTFAPAFALVTPVATVKSNDIPLFTRFTFSASPEAPIVVPSLPKSNVLTVLLPSNPNTETEFVDADKLSPPDIPTSPVTVTLSVLKSRYLPPVISITPVV